jgi:hypothetical protein
MRVAARVAVVAGARAVRRSRRRTRHSGTALVGSVAGIPRAPSCRRRRRAPPHHGSRSSSSAPRLSALGAREAVAQAGDRNRDGPPDAGVAARYAQAGIAWRRTDHAGALQWRMRPDGGTRHSAWRTEGVRSWHNRPGPRAQTDPVPIEPIIAGSRQRPWSAYC